MTFDLVAYRESTQQSNPSLCVHSRIASTPHTVWRGSNQKHYNLKAALSPGSNRLHPKSTSGPYTCKRWTALSVPRRASPRSTCATTTTWSTGYITATQSYFLLSSRRSSAQHSMSAIPSPAGVLPTSLKTTSTTPTRSFIVSLSLSCLNLMFTYHYQLRRLNGDNYT